MGLMSYDWTSRQRLILHFKNATSKKNNEKKVNK